MRAGFTPSALRAGCTLFALRAGCTLLALGALAGCTLRKARTDEAPPCASNAECDPNNVCFLGECRGSSAALSQVVVEVRPPNDSQLGLLQRASIDLHSSAVSDFQLQPLLDVTGSVVEAGDGGAGLDPGDAGTATPPLPGATLTFTDHAPAIPDRVHKVTVRSDANGTFSTRLPDSTWDLLVQAQDTSGLPPFAVAEAVRGTGVRLGLRVPDLDLARISGTLTAGGLPIGGASVSAIDAAGEPLAAPVTTVDGGFQLLLPPGPPPFRLEVSEGPSDGGTAGPLGDPLPSFLPFGPPTSFAFTDAQPITRDLGALPPAATLQGTVFDASSGAPIAAARVAAVSTDGNGWTLSRSTVAAADGSFQLQLRAGRYLVEAAPDTAADQPAVSGELDVTVVPAGPPLRIGCKPKTKALGLLILPGGGSRPVGAGYQVTATRLPDRVISGRAAFTTATDSAGLFHLIGDAGRYRVDFVPPHAAGLPRKTVQLELGAAGGASETALPAIHISPPLTVYGTVHGQAPGAADAPVASATVDFFALDASGKASVYLGTGLTDASGHYSAVLPDVPQPGLLP
jgi:hypothetical protein